MIILSIESIDWRVTTSIHKSLPTISTGCRPGVLNPWSRCLLYKVITAYSLADTLIDEWLTRQTGYYIILTNHVAVYSWENVSIHNTHPHPTCLLYRWIHIGVWMLCVWATTTPAIRIWRWLGRGNAANVRWVLLLLGGIVWVLIGRRHVLGWRGR